MEDNSSRVGDTAGVCSGVCHVLDTSFYLDVTSLVTKTGVNTAKPEPADADALHLTAGNDAAFALFPVQTAVMKPHQLIYAFSFGLAVGG